MFIDELNEMNFYDTLEVIMQAVFACTFLYTQPCEAESRLLFYIPLCILIKVGGATQMLMVFAIFTAHA